MEVFLLFILQNDEMCNRRKWERPLFWLVKKLEARLVFRWYLFKGGVCWGDLKGENLLK